MPLSARSFQNQDKAFKVAIMVYDQRSGSTLLAKKLNDHSSIVVTLESQFLLTIYKYKKNILDELSLKDLLRRIYNEKKFKFWGISDADLLDTLYPRLPCTKQIVVDAILRSYRQAYKPEAKYVIVKQGSPYHIQKYQKLIPDLKFLHIIRDGRAVLNSKLKSKDSESGRKMIVSTPFAAKLWAERVALPRHILEPRELYELHYEDLVASPENEMRGTFKYLGLDLTEGEETTGNSSYSTAIPPTQLHLHRNVAGPLLKERIYGWVNEVPRSSIICFERIAHDALIKNGYEPIYIATENYKNPIWGRCGRLDALFSQVKETLLLKLGRTIRKLKNKFAETMVARGYN